MGKEKITYILGAGASIGAFPLVKPSEKWVNKGLADSFIDKADYFESLDGNEFKNLITASLREVGKKGKEFGNIDSYAKYLYHTQQPRKLSELKLALTIYFSHTQLCQIHNDKRYINFVTSVITQKHQFPDNVKILNWNYDYLLEKAFMLYRKEEFGEGGGAAHRSHPFADYFPHCGYEFNLTHHQTVTDSFSIVHLNGIAGFYLKKNNSGNGVFHSIFNDLSANEYDTHINEKKLMLAFENEYSHSSHLMTFAWEIGSQTKEYLVNCNKIAKKIIKDTTTLVIIGYSFPFYNREVDNMIFDALKPSLKKIYYQDPNINGDFLRNRYDLEIITKRPISETALKFVSKVSEVKIEQITDLDQFYIPVEL